MPPGHIPYWQLFVAQFLFSVPYTYGAIAKLNEDWLLHAQPLRIWFGHRKLAKTVPFRLGFTDWFPWVLTIGGVGFDAIIVPLLFHKRMRPFAFAGSIFFNCMNKRMFNIGVFPITMLATLVLFLPPDSVESAIIFTVRAIRSKSLSQKNHVVSQNA